MNSYIIVILAIAGVAYGGNLYGAAPIATYAAAPVAYSAPIAYAAPAVVKTHAYAAPAYGVAPAVYGAGIVRTGLPIATVF